MSARSRPASRVRYRRAPHVISYWHDDDLVLHNYATGMRAAVAPLTMTVLACCRRWRTLSAIVRDAGLDADLPIASMLDVLVEATFLERSDRKPSASTRAYDEWHGWNPVASFFHAATKDVAFAPSEPVDAMLREKAIADPPPAMVKRVRGRNAVALPEPRELAGLTETLKNRRTWRRFGTDPISRDDLATLLHLTWGVQQWMEVDGFGRMPLKTSPSGGARHSIEAYTYVRRVKGVRAGLYHYAPDDHRLHRIDGAKKRASRGKMSDYLPTQTWYDEAAIVIFMTAVFARAQWRYDYARAYRSILTEAGHLAQTFCVIATRLGLAPFCSMALADSRIERDLGIDGVSESVVYATGAGTRPPGVEWAPWPDRDEVPARTPAAWTRRRPRPR